MNPISWNLATAWFYHIQICQKRVFCCVVAYLWDATPLSMTLNGDPKTIPDLEAN